MLQADNQNSSLWSFLILVSPKSLLFRPSHVGQTCVSQNTVTHACVMQTVTLRFERNQHLLHARNPRRPFPNNTHLPQNNVCSYKHICI